jgi:quinol-cytochrome oxidoreductase complex cytochrome b subunit
MRINRLYSKWSVLMIAASLLALGIINYLFFTENNFFFDQPFLINIFLLFIISVEVFTGLNQNRILKIVSYLLTMCICGYALSMRYFF